MLLAPFCLVAAPTHRPLLDAFFERCRVDDPMDEDTRRVDVIGIDRAGVDQLLDLGDGDSRGGCHYRVEVARRLAIDKIAFAVAFPGMDDGEVGDEAALHYVALTVEVTDFLAFRNQRPDARLGEECRYPRSAGPNPLRQGALGVKLDIEFAFQIKIGEELILTDIGRDHLANLSGLEQQSEPRVIDPRIV